MQTIPHLLSSLLEHQQRDYLHDDIVINITPKGAVARIGEQDGSSTELSVPAEAGKALLDYFHRSLGATGAVQEGIITLKTKDATYKPFARLISHGKNTYTLILSVISESLSASETVFSSQKRKEVRDMLNHRSGVVGASAPTHGDTLALLYSIGDLLNDHGSHQHIHLQKSNTGDPLEIFQNQSKKIPDFITMPYPHGVNETELWRSINQTSLAGNTIIIGLPGQSSHRVVKKLHTHVPDFLWEALFRGVIVNTPFPTACKRCAAPVSTHPDALSTLSTDRNQRDLKSAMSAHAAGCEHCKGSGQGVPLAALELIHPHNVNRSTDGIFTISPNLPTAVDDLAQQAHERPVPLKKAASLWKRLLRR